MPSFQHFTLYGISIHELICFVRVKLNRNFGLRLAPSVFGGAAGQNFLESGNT